MNLIRWPEVKALVKLSRPTVWRMERKGRFPQRKQLGENSVGWIESEIKDWIKSRPTVAHVEGIKE